MHSDLEVSLFVDATETLFRIGDQLHRQGFAIPAPPQWHGVANADEIRERMLHGINPIAAMSLDDAIGIRYGEDPAGHDLTVITGVHRGFLELMVAPDIAQVEEVRGRRIGIDTETGYARALIELLRRASLRRDHDFSVVRAGATNRRSVLAMLERCIDTPHTPETRQSILTTLFGPASQFLCDGRIQAHDLLSWISQRTSSGLTSE